MSRPPDPRTRDLFHSWSYITLCKVPCDIKSHERKFSANDKVSDVLCDYFYGHYCYHSDGFFGKLWSHSGVKGLDKGISLGLFQL